MLLQLLVTKIFRDDVYPVAEILDVITGNVGRQLFKYLDRRILALFLVVKVVHGDGKDQVAIAVEKDFNAGVIPGFTEIGYEGFVGAGVLMLRFYEFQTNRILSVSGESHFGIA